jgi:sodium/pantothenate symporter
LNFLSNTNASLPTVFAASGSDAALVTFLIYTAAVFVLAALSNRLLKSKNFVSEYFLGSRGLGVWAFALTFAATSSSGGSFTGFPSKIYTHGWILALWIGSYMVVPICTMGFIGKRLNQVARRSGSITVPDVCRDRFNSPVFGLMAVSLIVFFMSFNLVAQFKAGSLILQTLLEGVTLFESTADGLSQAVSGIPFLSSAESPEYLLCLLVFGIAVILYTTYGGFHAVVWTDVMQGIVMVVGVIIMLPLAISQAGGLDNTTRLMAKMTPPRISAAEKGGITLTLDKPSQETVIIDAGTWITDEPIADQKIPLLFRVTRATEIPAGETTVNEVKVLQLTTLDDIERILGRKERENFLNDVSVSNIDLKAYAYGEEGSQQGTYLVGPGPSASSSSGFLPLSLAISFFFMWAISGTGQPANMVRLMAFRDTKTLQRSICTVAIYYTLIYFPLVVIFCCARVLLPGMEGDSDRIMPAMAVFLTENIGMGWLAGLLVAAPFAAVMSTVDSFLLLISSAWVRDVYQRNINPEASEKTIKLLSYLATFVVGTAAMLVAVNPPKFLQDIIVYVGSGLAASFLAPIVYGLYWRRINAAGAMGAMIGGFAVHLAMYVAGYFVNGSFFKPYQLFDFDPIIIGLFVSFISGYIVTKVTAPPPDELVQKYFYTTKTKA